MPFKFSLLRNDLSSEKSLNLGSKFHPDTALEGENTCPFENENRICAYYEAFSTPSSELGLGLVLHELVDITHKSK